MVYADEHVIYNLRCFDIECYVMWLPSLEGEVGSHIIVK